MKDTLNKVTLATLRRTRARSIGLSLVIAAVGAAGAVPAAADVGPLPDDACNEGTRNAHQSVPHTNPAQTVNPGHISREHRAGSAYTPPAHDGIDHYEQESEEETS